METAWIWKGLALTIPIWLGALAIGFTIAPLVVAARRSRLLILKVLAVIWVSMWRGVPGVLWLFIIYFGLGWGPLGTPAMAAVIGLGLIASGYLSEGIRAAIEAVPKGQWEACQAVGLPTRVMFFRVIAPQAARVALASSATFSITLLKNTSLASLIGANELLWQANHLIQTARAGTEALATTGIIYIILSVPIGIFARAVEGRATMAERN